MKRYMKITNNRSLFRGLSAGGGFKVFYLTFFFAAVLLTVPSCEEYSNSITTAGDTSQNISYSVGSPRDKRLTFYDINRFHQIRAIPNNLSQGNLAGRVQFAQSHTIEPKGNKERNMPSLIPFRHSLLLFTPQTPLKSIKAAVSGGGKSLTFDMDSPLYMPMSDYLGNKPDITYSKRSWSCRIPWNYVTPDMSIRFEAEDIYGNILEGYLNKEDIEYGVPAEGVFVFIKLGMLTEVPNINNFSEYMLLEPERALQEYFQTASFARLVNARYEDRHLKRVIVASGKIYDETGAGGYPKASLEEGGVYSGDMRENVAKSQISVGINLANFGVPSWNMTQRHRIAHDPFHMTIHLAQGKYTNGVIRHGLSGGNGIGTFINTAGNEFSHEVAHFYGRGHYPHMDTTTEASRHGYDTGWGYDSYKNRMRANIRWGSEGTMETFGSFDIRPFQNTYNWDRDCMADADTYIKSAISNYTHSTGWTTRETQENFLSNLYILDINKKSYKRWDGETLSYKYDLDDNFNASRPNPTQIGVPVITILGGYNPDNLNQAVVYPYFRGNYGNTFEDALFKAAPPDTPMDDDKQICYLKIDYYDGSAKYVQLKGARHNPNTINQLQLNIAENDKPKQAALFCGNRELGKTDIIPDNLPPMDKPAVIGMDKDYDDILAKDIDKLTANLSAYSIDNYTLSDTDEEIIKIIDKLGVYDKISDTNTKSIAKNYIDKYKSIMKIDKFIEDNYYALENGDTAARDNLKAEMTKAGLGNTGYFFNQIKVSGVCLEKYDTGTSPNGLRITECSPDISQRWVMDKNGRLHSGKSPGMCIDGSSPKELKTCSSAASQRWIAENAGAADVLKYGANNEKCGGLTRGSLGLFNCNASNKGMQFSGISKDDAEFLAVMKGNLIDEIFKYINPDER